MLGEKQYPFNNAEISNATDGESLTDCEMFYIPGLCNLAFSKTTMQGGGKILLKYTQLHRAKSEKPWKPSVFIFR